MSVKYPYYVNLTSLSEEQPNERTLLPPPRKKSISPHLKLHQNQSLAKAHTHIAPPPELRFVILIRQEPQELPLLPMLLNGHYAQTMDNWSPGPSNPSPPPRVYRPPLGFQIHHPVLNYYH
nr:hypothetical protein [Tanacetum cinerariifolium]